MAERPDGAQAGSRTRALAAHSPSDKKVRYGIAGGCGCLATAMLLLGLFGAGAGLKEYFVDYPAHSVFAVMMAFGVGLPYAALIVWLDRNEREPFHLLLAAFCWGAGISVVVSGLFNTTVAQVTFQVTGNAATASTMAASLSAPFIEEITKGLAVLAIFVIAPKHFDNLLDGIVYGAVAGLGFAIVEDFHYFIKAAIDAMEQGASGYGTIVFMTWLRSVLGGIGSHAAYTGIFGASLGLFRMLRRGVARWLLPVVGLGLAMFVHALWNSSTDFIFGLVGADSVMEIALVGMPAAVLLLQVPFVLMLAAAMFFALRHESKLVREYLADESPRVVNPEEVDMLVPARRRTIESAKLLMSFQLAKWWNFRRRHAKLIKLAFEKWHMDKEHDIGDEETAHYHAQRVMELRQDLAATEPLNVYAG